jgi:hypothetical protein
MVYTFTYLKRRFIYKFLKFLLLLSLYEDLVASMFNIKKDVTNEIVLPCSCDKNGKIHLYFDDCHVGITIRSGKLMHKIDMKNGCYVNGLNISADYRLDNKAQFVTNFVLNDVRFKFIDNNVKLSLVID